MLTEFGEKTNNQKIAKTLLQNITRKKIIHKKNRALHNKGNHSQNINITNLYAPNNTASKYTKPTLWKLKGGFKTFFIRNLKHVKSTNKLKLIIIYRLLN